ncbi:N-acetyllactosaminide beta-1,3-N-acetylglucosaminyltransferase 2a [Boleophthalmus pectinirostris]|uniref:N-acetyllactosaminide beta-1,3-N-acetylglucosaminyltransferase 2a n=1 Tax=Boleophthalmus pectinirostris TaxID=150288 RepID=UPI00242B14A6|nr:N-acetyllactosaminide beta-1,3-N-acetylglucosaminyltransferase 2a [Boleophthalmus pectinirostris]
MGFVLKERADGLRCQNETIKKHQTRGLLNQEVKCHSKEANETTLRRTILVMRQRLTQDKIQIHRGAEMTLKIRMICAFMVCNIIGCIFLTLTWSKQNSKIRIPTKTFWQKHLVSKSLWNLEQQRLDFIHNPIFNTTFDSLSELPDWLNYMEPKSNPCEPHLRVQQQIVDYNLIPKQFQDFLLYSHCKSYPMLINQPTICEDTPFLLLVVKTLVPHFDRRQAIRETWGQAGVVANRTVATVFLLGNAIYEDNHPNLTGLLQYEVEMYGDILQWDYRDTFLNLTLKDLLFLDWFRSFCPSAQFVLKGDDDVFVNTPLIIEFLDLLHPKRIPDLFIGDVITNAGPHRNKNLKYFVPESYFVGSYPPYAGGGGFLYSGQVALQLHEAAKKVVVYPIDDVYTGMCLAKLGLAPEKHTEFRTFDIAAKYRDNPCIYRSFMVVHSRTPQEIKHIWRWIMHPELHCQ